MAIEIIRLGKSNADLLANVAPDVFDQPVAPDRVTAYVSAPNHIMLVAVSEGVVIGQALAVIHKHPDKPTELYVDDLAVAPAFQRQGIATRMLRQMEAFGRQGGCEEIWVATEPDNEPAKALYRSLGLGSRTAVVFERELNVENREGE